MRLHLTLTVLAVALFTIGTATAAERRAFILANSQYADGASISNLQAPLYDAQRYAEILKREGWLVTTAENKDLPSFYREFIEFLSHVTPGDDVAFFYSGHGLMANGDAYIIPIGSDLAENPNLFGISYIELSKIIAFIDETQAKQFVLIFDACRNAGGDHARFTKHQRISKPHGIIFSSSPGEVAKEYLSYGETEKLSVFSRFFSQNIDNPNTFRDAFTFTYDQVRDATKTDDFGGIQHPDLIYRLDEPFHFWRAPREEPGGREPQESNQVAILNGGTRWFADPSQCRSDRPLALQAVKSRDENRWDPVMADAGRKCVFHAALGVMGIESVENGKTETNDAGVAVIRAGRDSEFRDDDLIYSIRTKIDGKRGERFDVRRVEEMIGWLGDRAFNPSIEFLFEIRRNGDTNNVKSRLRF